MFTSRSALCSILALALVPLAGCVSSGKYDAALADATQARSALENQRRENASELARVKQQLAEAQAGMSELQEEVDFAGGIALACGEALDDSNTMNEGMQSELARLGKDNDSLAESKRELASSLERTRAGLEELKSAQAAAEGRAALFRDVAQRLRRMLDTGELKIALRSGRMVLVLPSDVLFDSGRARVGRKGRAALAELGAVLASYRDRRFQVSGHTDSDPIRVSDYASNWQLSSARALEVVKVLLEAGVAPGSLSAAGYAEFDPVAPNDTPVNKARNRRIEIVVQPNIDELVELPAPGDDRTSQSP